MRPVFLFSSLLALLPACSSEGKFCDKMRALHGADMNDCEQDALPEVLAQCKEPEKVFSCVADAKDKAAADTCWREKCEKIKK